jgi:hypothetical protein
VKAGQVIKILSESHLQHTPGGSPDCALARVLEVSLRTADNIRAFAKVWL